MNNLIQIINNEPVTTSLALAEGAKVDHKNVIQLVRKYAPDLKAFGGLEFKILNSGSQGGRPAEHAILNEPQATLIMTCMRNSALVLKFKVGLVKAFFEARNQLANQFNPASLSKSEILRLALESEEEKAQLTHQIKQDKPLVEFAQRHVSAQVSFTLTESAKQIGLPQKKFINWLDCSGYIYKQGYNKPWLPYADALKRKFFEIKLGLIRLKDGTDKATQQCRITTKGVQHFQKRLRRFGLI